VVAVSVKKKEANALGVAVVTAHAPSVGGAPADVGRELFVVTPKRLYRARLEKSRAPLVVVDETARLGAGLLYGTDVAAGDFDGDGVEDLAVADSGAIRILLQRPVLR